MSRMLKKMSRISGTFTGLAAWVCTPVPWLGGAGTLLGSVSRSSGAAFEPRKGATQSAVLTYATRRSTAAPSPTIQPLPRLIAAL